MTKPHVVADVLRVISDEKALELFRAIGPANVDSASLRRKTKLTRKQYYSRLLRMTRSGLVKRKNGKYVLTAFGKVVYDAQNTIQNAIRNYWEISTIDSLEMFNELPKEDRQKLIDALIQNPEIKQILAKGL